MPVEGFGPLQHLGKCPDGRHGARPRYSSVLAEGSSMLREHISASRDAWLAGGHEECPCKQLRSAGFGAIRLGCKSENEFRLRDDDSSRRPHEGPTCPAHAQLECIRAVIP